MRSATKALVGVSALAGAVAAVQIPAWSAAGDDVTISVGTATVASAFGDVDRTATGFKDCFGTVLDPNDAGESFRVAIPAACLDGFLVSGFGYGTLDEAEQIVVEPLTTVVDSVEREIWPSADLTNLNYTRTVASGEPFEPLILTLFDAQVFPCADVVLEVESAGGVFAGRPTGCAADRMWQYVADAPAVPTDLAGVVDVVAAGERRVALTDSGEVWQWFPAAGGAAVPLRVTGLPSIMQIAAGSNQTADIHDEWVVALSDAGEVWTWGSNSHGQLGRPGVAVGGVDEVPAVVPGLGPVDQVAAGGRHSLALMADGTVAGWGDNTYWAANGSGSPVLVGSPTVVAGLSGAVQITAGHWHGAAVLGDGSVVTWGNNNTCQLGRQFCGGPVGVGPASGLPAVVQVEAGGFHTAARTAAGEVWTWGSNNSIGRPASGFNFAGDIPGLLPGVAASDLGGFHSGTMILGADGDVLLSGAVPPIDYPTNSPSTRSTGWQNARGIGSSPTTFDGAIFVLGGTPPPVSTVWDDREPPPTTRPFCLTEVPARQSSCYETEADRDAAIPAATVEVLTGDRFSGGSVVESIVIVGPGCVAEWWDVAGAYVGTWLQSPGVSMDSACPLVVSTFGQTNDAAWPVAIETVWFRTETGMPVNLGWDGSLGERIMAIDPAVTTDRFATPAASLHNNSVQLSMWDTPATVDEDTIISVDSLPGRSGSVRMVASSTGYDEVDTDRLRYRRLDQRRWGAGDSVFFTNSPVVAREVLSDDPFAAELDIWWAWDNSAGSGLSNAIEPDEPFDVLVRPVFQPLRLVTLGDSYTAGEGASFQPAGDNGCSRSPLSYSGVLSQAPLFELPGFDPFIPGNQDRQVRALVHNAEDPSQMLRSGTGMTWAYIACGGAQVPNMWAQNLSPEIVRDIQKPDQPPDHVTQLNNAALDGVPSPNMVVLTAGGNDAGFSTVLNACWRSHIWRSPMRRFFPGASLYLADECEEAFLEKNPNNPDGLSAAVFVQDVLRPRLDHTYAQIRQEVPGVTEGLTPVYVLGYPKLVANVDLGCDLRLALGSTNIDWIRTSVDLLNQTTEQAATAAGFTYVDPIEFAGHEVCTDDPYVNGVVITDLNRNAHPNDAGYQAYAKGLFRVNQDSGLRHANGLAQQQAAGPPPGGGVDLGVLAAGEPSSGVDLLVPPELSGSIAVPVSVECGTEVVTAGASVAFSVELGALAGSVDSVRGTAFGHDELYSQWALVLDTQIPVTAGSGVLTVPLAGVEGPVLLGLSVTVGGIEYLLESIDVEVVAGPRSCAQPDQVAPDLGAPSVVVDVLANDTAGPGLNALSINIISDPVSGDATVVAEGVEYSPEPGFRHIDEFVYEVCDDTGSCSAATVTVDYTAECTIVGDGPGVLQGTAGDDVICGSRSFEQIEGLGGSDVIYPGGGGDRVDSGNGGGLVERSPDTVLVVAADTVTVTGPEGVNPPLVFADGRPELTADVVVTSASAAVIYPVDNDQAAAGFDPDSFTITSTASGVKIDAVAETDGQVSVAVRTEAPVVEAVLTYEICDLTGRCATSIIELTTGEGPPAVPPLALDDSTLTMSGEPVSVDVLANDTDPDGDLDPATLAVVTSPAAGTAEVITFTDGPEIIYTPTGDTSTIDTFTYQVCDTAGLCGLATVTVEVIAASDCTISGTDGPDTLVGTSGDDIICGFDGDDQIDGLAGADIILGGRGQDTLNGNAGPDTIIGGRGADTIDGGNGRDTLLGRQGADTITGNDGDDVIRGGRGADDLRGGAGNDTIHSGKGTDVLRGGNGNDVLRARKGDDTLRGGEGADHLYGGRGDDLLQGGDGPDELRGRRGNDTLEGGRGQDLLDGGRGADTGDGGPGADTCARIETATSCQQ